MIFGSEERMRFYLRSQMAFAAINALPGAFITLAAGSTVFVAARSLLATGFLWDASIPALGWFAYVVLAIWLFVQWITIDRHRSFERLREAPGILSIVLWAIPFCSFVVAGVHCYLAAIDDKPDLFNDVELNMYEFFACAALAGVWFFIPMLFAVLACKGARIAASDHPHL